MKKIRNVISIFILSFLLVSMSGCVTFGNKGVDDLTEEEKAEAVSIIEETKKELEDELSESSDIAEFSTDILDSVQDALEDE